MAYNKSKYVEAAQKLLNQGKVAQAIAEYQQILKHEPRDQVTLMTVGELYIRQGETFQAIDYFERLAQIFVGDGFLTKAIAVYKRIAKLAPEEIRPLEKLADLYVQQGVMSEARPLFLQLAEIHLKNNRQAEAVSLLKKLLAAEPDNLRIQVRLADLYQAMGQNHEAVDAYIAASQRALARGDQAECEKLADKAIKLDPKNLAAVILKARVHSTQGNFAQAAEVLEQVPDLEKGGEQAELLLDLYIKSLKWDQASALALKIFDADTKNFGPAQKLVEAQLESAQTDRAMAILDRTRIPMIDAGEHEIVGKLLTDLSERMPGRLEPLEWLVELYGRTSDSFRLPDALAHLGDALVGENKLERAKQIFEQLVDREPESEPAKRKLNDVLRRMGLVAPESGGMAIPLEDHAPVELAKPPAPKLRPDLEPSAPEVKAKPLAQQPVQPQQPVAPVEPALDDETQKFIAQSLTDVDLFASYGLTQKAIGLLEAILRRAPRHTPTLEKLLDFVLGAGDDRRTAELAAKLETIYTERNDARGAERFAELRRRFQRAAGLTDEELFGKPQVATPAASLAEHDAEATAVEELPELSAEPASDAAESQGAVPSSEEIVEEPSIEIEEVNGLPADAPQTQPVHEVDLSDEWANMLEEPANETEAASGSVAPAQQAAPEFEVSAEPVVHSAVEEFSISSDEPVAAAPEAPAPVAPSHAGNAAEEFDIPVETPAAEEIEIPVAEAEPVQETAPHAEQISIPVEQTKHEPPMAEPVPPAPVAAKPSKPESEFEVEQDYELVLEPEPIVPAYDQRPPETPIVRREAEPVAQDAASGLASDQFLADLANEIDQLGIGELSPEFSSAPTAQHEAPAPANSNAGTGQSEISQIEVGPLKEVFEEFRAELGEMGAEEEDLETHYNLGIAFREMGLLEEAISEFQKVAKAAENGRKFPYTMQCYTLLGLAFMDSNQPSIAALWYERALRLPAVEPESALALRYDLGVAQESAGESDAALKSFSQVYAVNIDYRDVGERIAALQKTTR
ncbi:MAG: tetratricopeptide repeat protein [Acidobacteria bacterium]|nr:tetratricopeptide repeat protein [Acidobacteriota bacterium]